MNQGSVEQLRLFVLELIKYLDKKEMVDELSNWKCPIPPITGKFLMDRNCPDGAVMGKVRQALISKWIDSRFQMSQMELGASIPGVLEGLKDFIAETANKRSGGKRKHVTAVKN